LLNAENKSDNPPGRVLPDEDRTLPHGLFTVVWGASRAFRRQSLR